MREREKERQRERRQKYRKRQRYTYTYIYKEGGASLVRRVRVASATQRVALATRKHRTSDTHLHLLQPMVRSPLCWRVVNLFLDAMLRLRQHNEWGMESSI